MRFSGFKPYFNKNSTILILGSFPSVKSRDVNFYYGNPRNRFWSLLAEAFAMTVPVTIDEKKNFLSAHKIALWDVVSECEITGSLDSNLKDFSVTNLYEVLDVAPIKKIIVNGKKASNIFKKYYPSLIPIAVFLPSTSPANTFFDKNLWLNNLR